MAHQLNRLTDRKVRTARAPDYYPDGVGLYVQVLPSGGKSWIYRFMIAGRARDMGLGSLLDVTLAEARVRRDDARKFAKAGVDPISRRNAPPEAPPVALSTPSIHGASGRWPA